MSESKKLMIGFGVIAVICCCAAGSTYFAFNQFGRKMENIVNADPTTIARAQDNIAEFEVPPGYTPMVMSLLGYDMINLMPETSNSGMTIMLMQYNGMVSGSPEQMEEQLRREAERQNSQPGASMQVVEIREESIRGQTVTVTISESSFQNFTMRQWTTVFQGNQGPTILIVQGPVEYWDDQLLNDFIESIH